MKTNFKSCIPLIILILIGLYPISIYAQQSIEKTAVQKTKLETFQEKSGSILIKGYEKIGTIGATAQYLATIEIKAIEFVNPTINARQNGIEIEIIEYSSVKTPNSSKAFIDYDEIDNLLKGLDYISKASCDTTKLSYFEVKYKTKGEICITIFNDNKAKINAKIKVGQLSAQNPIEKFKEFQSLIIQAKNKLDSLK